MTIYNQDETPETKVEDKDEEETDETENDDEEEKKGFDDGESFANA